MPDAIDEDLRRRTQALLEPGEIALGGAIVHTALDRGEESRMHQATIEVGDLIARHAGAGEDTYVYSGNDDPSFGSNQHQGRTLEDDAFVWECQQLLRDGTYDIVFYYEASIDQEALLAAIREAGYAVTGVDGR